MPQIKIYQEDDIPSPMRRLWQAFASNPFALAGLWVIIGLLFFTLFGPWLAPFSPEAQNPKALLLPP